MAHKTVEQAAANLDASIALIPDRYRMGVQSANWADPASSDQAEQNYATGVTAAVSAKRRQSRIREVGNEVWRSGALNKGATAIGPAIRANLNKYRTNFGRVYNAVLPAIQALPPRSTDAMSNIETRLKPVVAAWQANKL